MKRFILSVLFTTVISASAFAQKPPSQVCPPTKPITIEKRLACLEAEIKTLKDQLGHTVDSATLQQKIDDGVTANLNGTYISLVKRAGRPVCVYFDAVTKALLAETCDHPDQELLKIGKEQPRP